MNPFYVKSVVRRAWAISFLAVLAVFSAAGSAMSAADLWEVDTRRAPRCTPATSLSERIAFRHCEDGTWCKTNRDALLRSVAGRPLLVFIHGNWSSRADALRSGTMLKCAVERRLGDRPYSLVIWSWPSDRVLRRLRPDLQLKARYSDTQAFYLAGLLEQLDPNTPVTLLGFSYGARAATGSLELLAGGRVAGLALEGADATPPRRLNAILAATAMPADWLGEGRRHGRALAMADEMVVTINPADRVLKRYPKLYRGCHEPEALGYCGPSCLGRARAERVELLNVACSVGREHTWAAYLRSAGLRQAVVDALSADAPLPATTQPVQTDSSAR